VAGEVSITGSTLLSGSAMAGEGKLTTNTRYGRDIRLTEAYAPDIWVDYY